MMNQNTVEKLLDKKAVATLLSCSIRQVDYLREQAGLPYLRVGALVRFEPQKIAQWVESRAINMPAQEGGKR